MNLNLTQNLWSLKEWARVSAVGGEILQLVHEATNEDKWGPTGKQMEAVCRAFPRGREKIMGEIRWRLKNRDKAWRPCYKSLLLVDYLARNVADTYLSDICPLVTLLRTIAQSFYYTNPKGIDHGVSVRERAKNLADLLSDGLLLREERAKAIETKMKLSASASDGYRHNNNAFLKTGDATDSYDPYGSQRGFSTSVPRTREEQERLDMELALRLQLEEERRSGVSAGELEAMYHRALGEYNSKGVRAVEEKTQYAESDAELARRLQEEEEIRYKSAGQLPRSNEQPKPSASSTAVATAMNEPPANTLSAQAGEPKTALLEDLFAPAPPLAPMQAVTASAPGAVDPFDAFLDKCSAQQPDGYEVSPQGNQWGSPQTALFSHTNQWSQPASHLPPPGSWSNPQQHMSQLTSASVSSPPCNAALLFSNQVYMPSMHQAQALPQQGSISNAMNTPGVVMSNWGQSQTLGQAGVDFTGMDPMGVSNQKDANTKVADREALAGNMWGSLDQFAQQQRRHQNNP